MRILIIYERFLRPDREGSDLRLDQIVRSLLRQGHDVSFIAMRRDAELHYLREMGRLGIHCYEGDPIAARYDGSEYEPQWKLSDVLARGKFDVAILCLWFWNSISIPELYLNEIRRLSPSTGVAILSDDRHGNREKQRAALSGRWSDSERARDFLEREQQIYPRADALLCITEEDAHELQALSGNTPVAHIPMVASLAAPDGTFSERKDLIFIADYQNHANIDGLSWFAKEVLPAVRAKLPDARLRLVGAHLPDHFLEGVEGVVRVGFVQNLTDEFSKTRVFVSPIRYGTGIKTKNLAALAHGVPLICTFGSAEGLHVRDGESALLADSPKDLATAILRAYSDEALWQHLSGGGRRVVREHFSQQLQDGCIAAALAQLSIAPAPRKPESEAPFSVLRVEEFSPDVLTHLPGRFRVVRRLMAYARFAEQLAQKGDLGEARRQLSHVFAFVPNRVPHIFFYSAFANVVKSLEETYRRIGARDDAAKLRAESAEFLAIERNSANSVVRGATLARRESAKSAKQPAISVIIPTFNRRSTLQKCLAALAAQTCRDFEAIVVDDGSIDDTVSYCTNADLPFPLHFISQVNQGAGAARKAGVENAAGDLLLLINDDTIASPTLIADHLRQHRAHRREKIAVLGNFQYPPECRQRALSYYLSRDPLFFPQATLAPGLHNQSAYFITCNISVARHAVRSVGSFDHQFRVAEDTDLGIRLLAAGYKILYDPSISAIHDHLDLNLDSLIRRAQIYGKTDVHLLAKHPQLLGDGSGIFGRMDEATIEKMQSAVDSQRAQIGPACEALRRFESIDFSTTFATKYDDKSAADQIADIFAQAVPRIFWFYLLQSLIDEWSRMRLSQPSPKN